MHFPAKLATWLERVLGSDGGFTADPEDPCNWTGGVPAVGTLLGAKWGIAASTYPSLDIKALTAEQAATIYRIDYLRPLQADNYPDGVAFQMLDFAVANGPVRAVKALQLAMRETPDGHVGPRTIAALASYTEGQLVMLLTAERIETATGRSTWSRDGRARMNRLADNLRHGATDL